MKKSFKAVAGLSLSIAIASGSTANAVAADSPQVDVPTNPVVLEPAVPRAGGPTPAPFNADRILRFYQSDISSYPQGVYLSTIARFNELRNEHPEVMQHNMDETLRINNGADAGQVERALADDHDDLALTMSDGLGSTLGQHYRDAMAEHRLPKVEQLIAGSLGRGGGIASSTGVEKYYYDYDRPFVQNSQGIRRYHREGADSEYSTSPSFPSGHAAQATWKSTMMAYMLPELGTQLLARGSEVGYNRIVLGVHYPLDVIGGRMTGQAATADRLNDPAFRALLGEASQQLRAELDWRCGGTLQSCIEADNSAPYSSNEQAVNVFTERMTYGFDPIEPGGSPMKVPMGAEVLLSSRFPELSVKQRTQLLHLTALDSGYPLDQDGGSWQRINLAAAWNADFHVAPNGAIVLNGDGR